MSTNFTPSVQTVSITNGGTSEVLVAASNARQSIIINPQTEACLINFGATAGTQATGTLTSGSNPANNETIAVNGVTFTFKTTVVTPATDVLRGATADDTMTNFAAVLNASANASISIATYTVSAAILTVTYDAGGADGNAFTLADSSAAAVTRGAATLAGGSNTVGGITIASGASLTIKAGDGFGSIKTDIYVLSASNAAKINYLEGCN